MKYLFSITKFWVGVFVIFVSTNSLFAQHRIMPLGNSITVGINGSNPIGGFRDDLYTLLTNEGVNFDFVGSQSDGNPASFDTDHEGHNGWKADQINANINSWLNTYDPQFVLLHIGTNDVSADESNQSTINEIESIVDKIYNKNQNNRILICSLIPRKDSKANINAELNRLIKNLYYAKRASGYNIYYVGQNEVFNANPNWATDYMSDDVHPNDTGYNVMAEVYFDVLMNAINESGPIVIDNFNRTQLGITWAADPEYQIVANELSNTSTTSSWDFLATYIAQTNPTEVSIKWSTNADPAGINEGGVALMLDAPSSNASGYLVFRTQDGMENLWQIVNGIPQTWIGGEAGLLPFPSPGDEFKVVMRTDDNGHYFDCYINDQLDATLTDPNKLQGNGSRLYAGVMLKGNLNNNVNYFDILGIDDVTPPAAVTNLVVNSVTASSVTLNWSAPGDDGNIGRASGYDVRYSKNEITEDNFSTANAAVGEPTPSDPGTLESFVVTGLESNTTYYFALKTSDEALNVSPISNIVATTTAEGLLMVDDFNRTELGPNWTADPEFQIVSDELSNTSTLDDWGFMAVYNARTNPVEISFKWGTQVDAAGIEEGGLALGLDAPSPNANGYLVWLRPSNQTLNLYAIIGGQPDHRIGSAVPISTPVPGAGDVFKVALSSDGFGHHFDAFVNGQLAGRITDPNKEQGNATDLYAGVMLKGNRNNNIDDFTLINVGGVPTDLVYVSGDNQTGVVGKALPESLVVMVTDNNDIPVQNVQVNFEVIEGNGTLDIMPPDDNIRIEAEWGSLTSPMQLGLDPDASGGQYIYSPTGQPREGKAEYNFHIKAAGTYIIWGRYMAISDTGDSFFILVDGSPDTLLWDLGKPYGQWRWAKISDRNSGTEQFSLNVGSHTLEVVKRENNARLDKVIFTTDPNFQPSGKEEVPGYITNAMGRVSAALTLGTIAGINRVRASAPGLNGSPFIFTAIGVADEANRMEYVSGDNQEGAGGKPLAEPFVVQLFDQYDNPVPNWPVTFTVTAGGGSLSKPQPVLTDTTGQASVILTLGTVTPTNQVEASSPGLTPITFTATATSGLAEKIEYVGGDGQSGTVNTILPTPLQVRVVDNLNAPVANHIVKFKIIAGNGSLSPVSQTLTSDFQNEGLGLLASEKSSLTSAITEMDVPTNNEGVAQVRLTLGTSAGTNTVEASALAAGQPLTNSPITFTATGNADVPATLEEISGNNQTGAAGMPLPDPFKVKVVDQYGNPIAGHPVTFTVKDGDGTLDGPTLKTKNVPTEADGIASVRLTLGPTSGITNRVEASAEYNGTPLVNSSIIFEALAGEVQGIFIVSGSNQTGSAGWPLADSFKVVIQDNYGNPVGGYPVTFTVVEGNGTLNGDTLSTKQVTTDMQGMARVLLTLGPTPGAQNQVHAIALKNGEHLHNSPIRFKARAVGLKELNYVDGNNQTGTVGTPLPNPFKVSVVDSLNKAIPNYPVTYTVTTGGGNFEGVTQKQYPTNSNGIAEAILTLGPTPGTNNNVAEATATYNGNPLQNSPIVFSASADIGEPAKLVKFQGDLQKGVVGNPLPNPLEVQVTDNSGNPISGHPVTFTVIYGGGTLDGPTLTTKTVDSDTGGIAKVSLTLGPVSGDSSNVVEASSEYNGTPLIDSPVTFYASSRPSPAANISAVSNDTLVGTVGAPLNKPFEVKVTDVKGNGVPQHPVTFVVIAGGGKLQNGAPDTIKVVETNNAGIAGATLILGPKANDLNKVIAFSLNGPDTLKGSPVTFTAKSKVGRVDVNISTITATTPVPADNVSTSDITVTLMDAYGNPISNKVVTLSATGSNNNIIQPSLPTNEQGQAYGKISSSKAEVKVISARDVTDSTDLNARAHVQFTPLAPFKIEYVSGNGQTGNCGAVLKDSFTVKVSDMYGNPNQGVAVTFEVKTGGGRVVEEQPVYTDSTGEASSRLILGTAPGMNEVHARADGLLNSPVTFIANGVQGVAARLEEVSGNGQDGIAGETLDNPLVVRVTDSNGYAVQGVSVTFEVILGDGNFGGNSSHTVTSNAFGEASVYWTLGDGAGPNMARATAAGVSGSVTFMAEARPGTAAQITIMSGNNQRATIGTTMQLIVKVGDIRNNGVEGIPIVFTLIQGDAQINEPQPVVTNSSGHAGVTLSLGNTAGKIVVEAKAQNLDLYGAPVRFTCWSVAGPPVAMDVYAGNNQQGTVGRELVYPIQVLLTDSYGNPAYAGIPVTFVVTEGDGSLLDGQQVLTDTNGVASNRWVLGPNPGSNSAWVIKTGLENSPLVFSATGVVNKFPLFDAIGNKVGKEEETLEFSVQATDDDNDPITYGIRNKPSGATFDSTGSRKFSWKPNYDQAGVYTVHFMAWDNKGGFDDEPVIITVENVNRRPQITASFPNNTYITVEQKKNEIVEFNVTGSDPDNDLLYYKWTNNGVVVSLNNTYKFVSTKESLGTHTIVAEVSDGSLKDERTWYVNVKVPVELVHFTAEVVAYQGIKLSWETSTETDNAGFNVLRSNFRDGHYQKVNATLIPANVNKKYSFIDKDAGAGRRYFYKLEDVSLSGIKTLHGPIEVEMAKPEQFHLAQNYPNPFNPNTRINYELPKSCQVQISIYNILGQRVRTLVDGFELAGYHTAVWDGKNDFGVPVSSGVYYYRMQAGEFIQNKKMVLLK